jgi:2-haloacid dehalogenase/putative hydrolase of the HAD superfamily
LCASGAEWVFLDVDGTILQEDIALLESASRWMESRSGGRHTASEIGAWWEDRWYTVCDAACDDAFETCRALVARSIRDTAERFGLDMDVGPWVDAIGAYLCRPTPFFDARTFLDKVGVPVCLLTNRDTDDLDAALAHVGFSVDCAVTSEQVRAYKPHPRVYEEAIRRTGTDPARTVHVGNSHYSDVRGAQVVGLSAIWLNRDSKPVPDPSGPGPDRIVTTLLELLPRAGSPAAEVGPNGPPGTRPGNEECADP